MSEEDSEDVLSVVTMTKEGRIVIPKEVRDSVRKATGIDGVPRMLFQVTVENGFIVLKPGRFVPDVPDKT